MTGAAAAPQLVEFRSYTLVPGGADAFVEHFERHFLATQEELGMDIVGQFTVPGDDARFVWVRRFLHPASRAAALASFYGGPTWKEFGPRANELMLDHTDVHLLVPDPSAPSFVPDHARHAQRPDRPDQGDGDGTPSVVVAAIYDLGAGDELPAHAAEAMTDALHGSDGGVTELGRLVTAGVPNDFPLLPVHEDATVALWLLSDRMGGMAATTAAEAVSHSQGLTLRTMSLAPTARSTLR
jgi:hypothetical protein